MIAALCIVTAALVIALCLRMAMMSGDSDRQTDGFFRDVIPTLKREGDAS